MSKEKLTKELAEKEDLRNKTQVVLWQLTGQIELLKRLIKEDGQPPAPKPKP